MSPTIDAIRLLLHEGRQDRITKRGLASIRRAAKTLNLDQSELVELETLLDYRSRETGELYSQVVTVKERREVRKFDWSRHVA